MASRKVAKLANDSIIKSGVTDLTRSWADLPTKAVVFFSGGEMSWAAGKRAVDKYGVENTTLLFTDTLIEDLDLYRFLQEAADNINRHGGSNISVKQVRLEDGRTPWEVFDDVGMLGNSRFDPCSRVLKREPAEAWLTANCDPADTVLVCGIDWTETHRYDGDPKPAHPERRTGFKNRYAALGWPHTWAPMTEAPYLGRREIGEWLKREGIKRARLYEMGFAHNNCGGFCVKAGKGHWAHLLRTLPEVYARAEAGEIAFNAKRPGKPFQTIVQDVHADRPNTPVSLTELRKRIQAQQVDLFDIGGCGCFVDDAA